MGSRRSPRRVAFGTVSLRRTAQGFELGYALALSRSASGIVTRAVRRLMAWVDEQPKPMVVSASTDPDDVASTRVLEKCGFQMARREVASWSRPSLGDELRDSLIFERCSTHM